MPQIIGLGLKMGTAGLQDAEDQLAEPYDRLLLAGSAFRGVLRDAATSFSSGEVAGEDEALDFANERLSRAARCLEDVLGADRPRLEMMATCERRIGRTIQETGVALSRLTGAAA